MGSSTIARRFCSAAGLNKYFSAAIDTYTEATAALLCRAWCHTMNHFFAIWVAAIQDGDGYVFTDADKRSYSEPTELAHLADATPGDQKALWQRINQIRNLCS